MTSNNVNFKLGDIIKIIAPNDKSFNKDINYLIEYIDEDKIRLEEGNGNEITLTRTDGYLDNESIESIIILSRAEEPGYARQNNLISGVWIDLFFGGDLPLTLTGKITNLEEDKIEITTFPDNEVIFIDFAYKGLPEDLQIEKIQIRRAPDISLAGQMPVSGQTEQTESEQTEQTGQTEQMPESLSEPGSESSQGYISMGEAEPEDTTSMQNTTSMQSEAQAQELQNLIYNADKIKFGDYLEPITQMVDVPEEEQRYDIDQQLDDLLNDIMSSIPNAKRTDAVKNNINKMIHRFKELREQFSIFDNKGYALMPSVQGAAYKPLIQVMKKLDKQLYWMLPVVKTVIYVGGIEKEEEDDEEEEDVVDIKAEDIEVLSFLDNYNEISEVIKRYEDNNTGGDQNKYEFLQKTLNPFSTPFARILNNEEDVLFTTKVNSDIMTVVDNLDDFNSTVNGVNSYSSPISSNKFERKRKQEQKRFFIQNFNTGLTGLEMTKMRGGNLIINRKELYPNDTVNIKSLMTLQEPTVRFSRINLYTSNILEKSNLNLHYLNYWQLLTAKTSVSKTTLKDITKPYNHEEKTFLKKVKHFTVDDALLINKKEDKDFYNKFLDTVIPKTKFLFNLIKPYLTGKLSINDILTYLEPFMIYQQDLTFMQFKEMNEYKSN